MDNSEYTIEREFLNNISIADMLRNIIISHQEKN